MIKKSINNNIISIGCIGIASLGIMMGSNVFAYVKANTFIRQFDVRHRGQADIYSNHSAFIKNDHPYRECYAIRYMLDINEWPFEKPFDICLEAGQTYTHTYELHQYIPDVTYEVGHYWLESATYIVAQSGDNDNAHSKAPLIVHN